MISPNIIITKRYETIRRIFFGPSNLNDTNLSQASSRSFSESVEGLSKDSSNLICAPGTNHTLLEADMNMPTGGNAADSYLNIKLVESSEMLEYFALDLSPLDTQFNRLYTLMDKAGISLGDSFNRLNRYYIAFGTGDDLGEWAGPFEVTLGNASVNLDNNVKTINLGFVMGELGSVRSYTSRLFGNTGFLAEKFNVAVPQNSKIKVKGRIALNKGLHLTKGPYENPAQIERKRALLPPAGWNSYIRNLLRMYLSRIYGDFTRIMVLLSDDFDSIFNKDLTNTENTKDFLRNYEGALRQYGIKLYAHDPLHRQRIQLNGSTFTKNPTLVKAKREMVEDFYEDYFKRQGNPQAIQEKVTEFMKLYDGNRNLQEASIKMETSFVTAPTSQNPETLLDPIFKFIRGLKVHQGSPTEYALFELNDCQINELLNQASGFKYPSFTSRIIFGDINIIKKLIYLSNDAKDPINESTYGKLFTERYLDRIDWEGYSKSFRDKILSKERQQVSSFKEKLDFGPFTPEFKEIEDVKDIIFLHGVKNSNVQSVNFQKDAAQGALLNFNVRSKQRGPHLNTFSRLAVTRNTFKLEALTAYLDRRVDFGDNVIENKLKLAQFLRNINKKESEELLKLEENTYSEIAQSGRKGSKQNLNTYIDLIVGYRKMLDDLGDGYTVEVPYSSNNSIDDNVRATQVQVDLLEQASRLITQLNIKTLPFFNQKMYFNKNCYFFSMYNNIIKSTNTQSSNIPSTLLNGSYKIIGCRHFMSADNAFSEFTIVKEGPQRDPVLEKTKETLEKAASPLRKVNLPAKELKDAEVAKARYDDLKENILDVVSEDKFDVKNRQEAAQRLRDKARLMNKAITQFPYGPKP